MNALEIAQMIVAGFGIATLTGLVLWIIGGLIYFVIMDIRDIPKTRATKAMNARVDAVKAANRARVEAELDKQYPQRLAYRAAKENDRKWFELVGRRD